jgi:DNA-binding NarL/FixJ family response regulator/predicted negative regulator of RcsB-dependent stress response
VPCRSTAPRPRVNAAGMSAVLSASVPPRPHDRSAVRALIVDEHAATRVAVRGLLQGLGIEQVQQAGDPIRAIRMMEFEAFDLVLCEANFRSQMDGSQVLEYVRTRRLLAPAAAFLLMSAEAMRSLVASARDWQPDGFVLKPLTAAALGPRIEHALRRRATHAPLFEAAEAGDPETTLAHARRLAAEAGGSSLELLRWQARALIDLGRFHEVREVCDTALELRADLAWAAVALAHCERAESRVDEAILRLRATVRLHPASGEAYDLLIDLLQEQGQTARALAVARQALEQLSTTQRLRSLGEIALAQGELEQAEACYTELIRRTSSSLTRSPLDTCMLGQVFVDRGAADKALRVVSTVEGEVDLPSRALAAAVQAQAHVVQGDPVASEAAARRAVGLASGSESGETVLLLVAHGAFAAGLHDEGRRTAERAVALRRRARGPCALARRVLTEAGIEPEAFARDASPLPEPLQAVIEGAAAPGQTAAHAPVAAPAGGGTAADDVAQAMASLHRARFDDAMWHIASAREKLPSNPMVLMAAVQVQMLRMRAKGFDPASAEDVRGCLAELDRQIPGERRVFPAMAVATVMAAPSPSPRT